MTSDLGRWRGRVALVTGASSGIGRAIAEDLGRLGLKVALTARLVRAAGGEAFAVPGDQADPEFNRRLFREVADHWGPPDILVNNAGAPGGRSLLGADLAEIDAALAVNVRAAVICMREAAAAMKGKTEGAVIGISSMTGHRLLPGTPAVYAATKQALRILTEGFRAELVLAGQPIKVALISPGLVDTPWHARPDGIRGLGGAYPYPPLAASDIAAAIRYILSASPGAQVCDIQLRPTGQAY
jgi:NAD(P)-dependent dehydrogenase (short-subunit alcohol dehydrogenase family)